MEGEDPKSRLFRENKERQAQQIVNKLMMGQSGLSPEELKAEQEREAARVERYVFNESILYPERALLERAIKPTQVVWAHREMTDKVIYAAENNSVGDMRWTTSNFWTLTQERVRRLNLQRNPTLMKFVGLGRSWMFVDENNVPLTEEKIEELIRIEDEQEFPFLNAVLKFGVFIGNYHSAGGDVSTYAKTFLTPSPDQPNPTNFKAVFNAGPKLIAGEGNQLPDEFMDFPETRHWGNDADMAIRAYWIIGLSEKPEELINLMKRPGFKKIFCSAKKEGQTDEDFIKEWIGEPTRWKREKRSYKDVEDEDRNGLRGKLTKFGNTWTHKEGVIDRDSIRANVSSLIGGNETAEQFSFWMYRVLGIAASQGSEVYWDGSKYYYDVEGFPGGSDDLIKLMNTRLWQLKEQASEHPAGPGGTVGKVNAFCNNFFDFTACNTQDGNGKRVKRTITEQMWGYNEGDGLPTEPAKRLGEVNWEELPVEAFRDWMLRIYWAGREEKGMLAIWTQMAHDPRALRDTGLYRLINKALNIIGQQTLISGGKLRGQDEKELKSNVETWKKTMKKSWWDFGIVNNPSNRAALKTKNQYGHTEQELIESAIGEACPDFYTIIKGYSK